MIFVRFKGLELRKFILKKQKKQFELTEESSSDSNGENKYAEHINLSMRLI